MRPPRRLRFHSAQPRVGAFGGTAVGDDLAVEDLYLAGHPFGDRVVVGNHHDG
jgi:hypothetical protein